MTEIKKFRSKTRKFHGNRFVCHSDDHANWSVSHMKLTASVENNEPQVNSTWPSIEGYRFIDMDCLNSERII